METAPPGLGASPPLRGAPRKSLDQRNIKVGLRLSRCAAFSRPPELRLLAPVQMETYSWVGSTINMAMPQLAGAIDILVVQQPDGSLKSSPFYGKDAPD